MGRPKYGARSRGASGWEPSAGRGRSMLSGQTARERTAGTIARQHGGDPGRRHEGYVDHGRTDDVAAPMTDDPDTPPRRSPGTRCASCLDDLLRRRLQQYVVPAGLVERVWARLR